MARDPTLFAYGNPGTLYFSAGLAQETHGLFAAIDSGGATGTAVTFNLSASTQVASATVGGSALMTVSVAPSNSFAGSVNLSCTGLPTGTTCNFATSPLSVLPNVPATTTLTTQTSAGSPGGRGYVAAKEGGSGRTGAMVALALTLPFGSLLAFGRRQRCAGFRTARMLAILVTSAGLMVGCSYSAKSSPAVPGTPVGTANVTITAVSGTITQSTVVNLTIH